MNKTNNNLHVVSGAPGGQQLQIELGVGEDHGEQLVDVVGKLLPQELFALVG